MDESKCWDQPGTEVTAICTMTGDYEQNLDGEGSRTWVGVVIPEQEILIDKSTLPHSKRGEHFGYAPEIWLQPLTGDTLHNCESVAATG